MRDSAFSILVPIAMLSWSHGCSHATTPPQTDVEQTSRSESHGNIEDGMANRELLVNAIADNDLAKVRSLAHDCGDLSFLTDNGYDLVSHAMNHGAEEVASFLIDCPVNLANPNSEFTPMQCALEEPYYDLINKLLDKGVDLNVKGKGETGYALHVLCWGYLEPDLVQRFLDADADPCARDDDGRTALDIARDVGNSSAATAKIERILLEAMKKKGCD